MRGAQHRVRLLAGLLLLAGCPKGAPDVDPKIEADGYYVTGQSAFLKGDFEAAHKAFAETRRLNPSDKRLPAAEGEVFLAEAKVDDALPLFEEAARADPSRATVWSRLGGLYALKKKPDLANEALAKALKLNPNDFNALEALADVQAEAGEVAKASATLERAALVAPKASQAALIVKATALLTKAKLGSQTLPILEHAWDAGISSAEVANELGDRLVEAGRLEEAIAAYTRAAEQNPADPSLWELVGELHRQLKRPKEAEAAFRKAIALKDRGVVHVALARLCLDANDRPCAMRELDQALATATGESLRETLELGDLLSEVGRKKDALALLRTVADEADQRTNLDLQLKTARLAAELKDSAALKAACVRVLSAHVPGQKCP